MTSDGSDSGKSVEEITAEDFKQEPNTDSSKNRTKSKKRKKPIQTEMQQGEISDQPQQRVYTMEEIYKTYPAYARRLYNFAWSQAVQNKPLNEGFERDSTSTTTSSTSSKEVEKIVIDDSADEDGELEEGEIGFGSDAMNVDAREVNVKSVREALESVTEALAEKSFQEVCESIQTALESLRELVSRKDDECSIEGLDQLVMSAIRVVNSVLYSMESDKKKCKDVFIRLLTNVKSSDPPLLSSQQLNEIELMLLSWTSISSLFSSSATEKTVQVDEISKQGCGTSTLISAQGLNSLNKPPLDIEIATSSAALNDANVSLEALKPGLSSLKPLDLEIASSPAALNDANMSLEALKPGLSSLKVRGSLPPLLDLHKDHDVDSLPSPTREAPLRLPTYKSLPTVAVSKTVHSKSVNKRGRSSEDSTRRFFETDALKAVSFYQQKFGQNSFSVSDRLPSPTPSEDGNIGDANIIGEVSSRPVSANNKTYTPISGQAVDKINGKEPNDSRNAVPTTLGPSATSKGPRKYNDPRLQFATSKKGPLDLNQRPLLAVPDAATSDLIGEIASSNKPKTNEEPYVGPASKRQRNGLGNFMAENDWKICKEQLKENAKSGPMEMDNGIIRSSTALAPEYVSGTGGWLEETVEVASKLINKAWPVEDANKKDISGQRKLNDGLMNANASYRSPTVGTIDKPSFGTTASLPGLLNNIAVNPSIFINVVTSSQQRTGSETQHTSAVSSNGTTTSSLNSVFGAVSAVNLPPTVSAGLTQTPAGMLRVTSPTPSDDSGKMRMKPRDPRRALHINARQKSGLPTTNNQEAKENISRKRDAQVDLKPQSGQQPNRTQQSTKILKNVADMVPSSQVSSGLPSVTLSSSQPGAKSDDEVMRPAVLRTSEQKSRSSSASELGVVGSRSQNTWADVERLLEGYDDQQKAAIQRERARRMEEQKKMFAARKLCLVLDLDHTLLNSAKFSEIEPTHERILRKKEVDDREKPYRHLFRFSHMGMWTKLRPGVWNFLERASQLFELHLYTMGNKVYATEMAKVLDPKGTLFSGRVISRGDDGDLSDGDERVPRSKDLEGVLGMESSVVIIDDSIKVWPHNKPNLIVVERYTYFPCSRRQFGLFGPSLLEIDHDERPEAGTLAACLGVIESIHQSFFSHPSLDDVDVRAILADEQRKILAGCVILFSRVFPLGEANPHLHPLWQTAEQFGGICTTQQSEQVTHVVAITGGTDKVNWAVSRGKFVVNPGWVEASALLYRRANEAEFVIKDE